ELVPVGQGHRADRDLHDVRAAVLDLDAARLHHRDPARPRGGRDGRRQHARRCILQDPAAPRRARPRRDVRVRVHPGMERVHLRLHPLDRRAEADVDRVALGLLRDGAWDRLGRADGRLDVDRDPRHRLLHLRPAAHRLRAHPGGRQVTLECLLPSFQGPALPDWVRRLIADGLGGVVLFGSNIRDPEQLVRLTSELRAENDTLLIALDEEGGDVTRLHAVKGSPYPGNAALGAVDDLELTERVAASIGAELAAVGVNLDFAPVADVNVDPANPVIGVRSFGADAELVARHVAAYVTGLQSTGVAGCAKHFPGHGATDRDSHLELATLAGDVADGLPPFRAAINAG